MQINRKSDFIIRNTSSRLIDVVLKERKDLARAARSVSVGHASISLLLVSFTTLILALSTFCILSDLLTPAEASAAVFTAVGSGGYNLSVSGAGDISLGLNPTAGGAFKMGMETLNIKTNASGYQAYISTGDATTSLIHADGTTTLPATNAAYSAGPDSIETNSWGFAVPASYKDSSGTTITNSNLNVSGFGNVDSGYSIVNTDTSLEASTKWASIPEKNSPLLIQSTSSAESTNGVDLGIFYAAKVNSLQTAGIYKGEVLYTVLANTPSTTEASITPGIVNNLGGNNTFTINLALNTTYTSAFSNSTIVIGDKPCTVTGGGNAASDGTLYLACTDTKQFVTGRYDVTITVSDGSNNYGTYYIGNGVEYRSVTSPNIEWSAPTTINNAESFARTLRIQTDLKSTDITLDSATVKVGTNNCTNPTITTSEDKYLISCTAPIGLAAGDYQVTLAMAKSGDTLVDLNTTLAYSGTKSIFGVSSLQELTTDICSITPTPGVTKTLATRLSDITIDDSTELAQQTPSVTLLDERDNQSYTVRKLADGNCWMTDNLRLGKPGTITGTLTLDSTDSNLTAGRTFSLPAATTTAGTSWANTSKTKFIFYRDSNPGAINATVKPTDVTPDGPSALYNWYTATAGARSAAASPDTETGDCSNTPEDATNCGSLMAATTGQAADSICPKNWQLPVNGTGYSTSKSYMNLVKVYTGATGNSSATAGTEQGDINENRIKTLLDSPTSFIYSDYYSYGGALYSRPVGNYWSSTVGTADNSYRLYFNTDGTNRLLTPQGSYFKGYAFAVRCVVQ